MQENGNMPAEFVVVSRKDPLDLELPPRYYPRAKSSGTVGIRELAEEIAGFSSLSTVDVMAALEGLLQVIPRHINNGKLVRLGDLGTFRLTFKGKGADSPEAVTAQNIKSTRLIFRPGKEFRKALKAIQYRKAVK
jgi:predicted histone-like DNA-binding protein